MPIVAERQLVTDRPVEEEGGGDIAVEIIQDLIGQGYRRKKLVTRFRKIRDKTPALKDDFGDFSVQILNEMVEKGHSVNELIPAFKEQRVKIAEAFSIWERETEKEVAEILAGTRPYYTMEEVFGKNRRVKNHKSIQTRKHAKKRQNPKDKTKPRKIFLAF